MIILAAPLCARIAAGKIIIEIMDFVLAKPDVVG
jgi:hypothetical protein